MTSQRGFTLIELAIVLVIVTILIGGLAVPLSAQIQARRIAETRQTLQEAREAILGYAMTHLATPVGKRRLPCPDTDGDGIEDLVSNDCKKFYGWMPWVSLGTAPNDAWGNRLGYGVIEAFGSKASGFSSSSALNNSASTTSLSICTVYTCSSLAPDVAKDIAFVLVSHGPNGWGARNVNGNTLATPSGPDEQKNLKKATEETKIYVSRSQTKPGAANGEYDDLIVWISFNQLIARVCPAGSDCNP